MEEIDNIKDDLVQISRLAVSGQTDDVRLYVARMVRKYRKLNPELALQFDNFLKSEPARGGKVLRKSKAIEEVVLPLPVDHESRLSLLKEHRDLQFPTPLLPDALRSKLDQLIQERGLIEDLRAVGLSPTKSAIFLGPPGVGKTLTARWIASNLKLPLYVLDLTTVMSSYLGRTGSNIRAAIDYAKQHRCVLLLDEIDAIAKRRSDDSDIGELKRLVTVILQEVDEWPDSGLLLAATNHPELIDPALWRRFDLVIDFPLPHPESILDSIRRFMGSDSPAFESWVDILAYCLAGSSYSAIEKTIQGFRRSLILKTKTPQQLIEEFVTSRTLEIPQKDRITLATLLAKQTKLSQHKVSEITGVSRDTIRKHEKLHSKGE
jgi:SpoVK/Ycf46/Vps4 family AAA+-type ATPase